MLPPWAEQQAMMAGKTIHAEYQQALMSKHYQASTAFYVCNPDGSSKKKGNAKQPVRALPQDTAQGAAALRVAAQAAQMPGSATLGGAAAALAQQLGMGGAAPAAPGGMMAPPPGYVAQPGQGAPPPGY